MITWRNDNKLSMEDIIEAEKFIRNFPNGIEGSIKYGYYEIFHFENFSIKRVEPENLSSKIHNGIEIDPLIIPDNEILVELKELKQTPTLYGYSLDGSWSIIENVNGITLDKLITEPDASNSIKLSVVEYFIQSLNENWYPSGIVFNSIVIKDGNIKVIDQNNHLRITEMERKGISCVVDSNYYEEAYSLWDSLIDNEFCVY